MSWVFTVLACIGAAIGLRNEVRRWFRKGSNGGNDYNS
jgi:SNF family Na+-dependent transporter